MGEEKAERKNNTKRERETRREGENGRMRDREIGRENRLEENGPPLP
jgi:hypothetical protein